ncbi:hypothetical protein CS542_06715 [Pedobacter sp. IW39]|nr:hypothetical protein CS542_06715 [Pedobacter sp. IW39]
MKKIFHTFYYGIFYPHLNKNYIMKLRSIFQPLFTCSCITFMQEFLRVMGKPSAKFRTTDLAMLKAVNLKSAISRYRFAETLQLQ